MSDLQKFLIKAYVRKGLAILGGILITHGTLPIGSADTFASTYLDEVAGAAMLAFSAGWTYFYQWYVKRKVVKALELPPGTSSAKLEQEVAKAA